MDLRRILLLSCSVTFVSSMFTPVFRGTVEKTFGGQMQFLTMIALCMTCMTLLLNQLAYASNLTYDFMVLTTTVETIVTVYYWSMFHYSRGLLYPKNMPSIPFFVDIFLHFLPATAIWMELLTTVKLHRISRKHIYIIISFSISYMLWAEYCYMRNGYYVYPILSMLDLKGKVALTATTIVVGILVYIVSVQVHTIYGIVSGALTNLNGMRRRNPSSRAGKINSRRKITRRSLSI